MDLAKDDILAAKLLLEGNKNLHAGFFFHLTVEKALKAMIASITSEIPPKTHNLSKLAEIGAIYDDLTESQLNLLEELNPLNIEARYPSYKESIIKMLTDEKLTRIYYETEDFLSWIKKRLEK
jgi:HEPN domain-containing protein